MSMMFSRTCMLKSLEIIHLFHFDLMCSEPGNKFQNSTINQCQNFWSHKGLIFNVDSQGSQKSPFRETIHLFSDFKRFGPPKHVDQRRTMLRPLYKKMSFIIPRFKKFMVVITAYVYYMSTRIVKLFSSIIINTIYRI